MVFFFILAIFVIPIQVKSLSICESDSLCSCRYNSTSGQDFLQEYVDCSYTESFQMLVNYSLPRTVYSLDLSSNKLTNVTFLSILQSKTMSVLYLNNNEITYISPDAMQLPGLKRLDLSYNQLNFIHQDTFKNFKQLEYLNLANNKLTTFLEVSFQHLNNLNEVILDNNYLGPTVKKKNIFDRNGFGLSHKIKSLSISGIHLNNIPDNFFIDAYDLKKLVVANNNISEMFEIPFTLEYLDLSDNPLSEMSSEDFSDLPALKVLKLNNLLIREVSDYLFASLHGLTQLQLERNKNLTIFSPLAFGREVLEDADDFLLEVLSLSGSSLWKLDSQLMQPLGQLAKLDLQGNPWKCDCNLVWLKKLQIPPNDYDHLRCNSPKPLYNSKIFELDAKYFKCLKKARKVGGIIAVVTLCVLLSAIAIWIFMFLPKKNSRCNYIINMYPSTATYSVLPVSSSINDR